MMLDSNLVEAVSKYNVPSVVRGQSSKAECRLCVVVGRIQDARQQLQRQTRPPAIFLPPPLPAQQAERHPCILNATRLG
jgi:hypothetical protein